MLQIEESVLARSQCQCKVRFALFSMQYLQVWLFHALLFTHCFHAALFPRYLLLSTFCDEFFRINFSTVLFTGPFYCLFSPVCFFSLRFPGPVKPALRYGREE